MCRNLNANWNNIVVSGKKRGRRCAPTTPQASGEKPNKLRKIIHFESGTGWLWVVENLPDLLSHPGGFDTTRGTVARTGVTQLGVTTRRQNFCVAPPGKVNFTVPKVAGGTGGVTRMLASGGAISVGQFTRSSESWNL